MKKQNSGKVAYGVTSMVKQLLIKSILVLTFIGVTGCPAIQPTRREVGPPQSPLQSKIIQGAQAKLEAGNYAGARADAVKLIASYPASPYSADAQYIIAMSYLREGNESSARAELERFLKNYPNGPKTAGAAATLRSLESRRFQEILDSQQYRQTVLEQRNRKLAAAVASMKKASRSEYIYIVIDVQADMLMVKLGDATLYAFPCATGKGEGYLITTRTPRRFATPMGKMKIISKEKNPVWYRPNWYWLERGEEVPEGITKAERAVYGALGKYKLDIGDAFYIHGHPGGVKPGKYTHGCIRINESDLELLYDITEVGTEVYIF